MSEEPNTSSQEPQDAPEPSLGAILKAAREARGMTVADVATALHLRPSIVKDIEADDFSNIASSTYVRGYVKNFARIVEADKQQVEACLSRQAPGVSQPAMQSFSRKTVRQARDSRYQMVTWLVIIILLGLLVFWWLQTSKYFNNVGVDFSKPTAEEVAASSADSPGLKPVNIDQNRLSTVSGAEQGTEQVLEQNPIGTAQTESEQAQSVEPDPLTATQQANFVTDSQPAQTLPAEVSGPASASTQSTADNAVSSEDALELALSADCWIQVKDASGKVLLADLRKAGQTVSLSGKAPFNLILGAPQAVTVIFNGEAVGLDEFPAGKVARFALPKNG